MAWLACMHAHGAARCIHTAQHIACAHGPAKQQLTGRRALTPGASCIASNTSSAFCQALVRAHCWMSDVNAAARGWNVLSRIARRTSPVPGAAALTASRRLSMSVAGALPCTRRTRAAAPASAQQPQHATLTPWRRQGWRLIPALAC
jgi:hypothetical protein